MGGWEGGLFVQLFHYSVRKVQICHMRQDRKCQLFRFCYPVMKLMTACLESYCGAKLGMVWVNCYILSISQMISLASLSPHTQLFNRSQDNVGKGITLFIKIQPRGLLHTLNTNTVTYKEKSGFFFFMSWSHCSLHFIKIYYVIFHIFYNWKAIKNTITINTHTTNSFLKELFFFVFYFTKPLLKKRVFSYKTLAPFRSLVF